jgi:hypothetical protein
VYVFEGKAGKTFCVECDGEPQSIDADELVDAYGRFAIGILVQVESGTARFAFGGSVPSNGGEEEDVIGHLLDEGQCLAIGNLATMRGMQFIDGGGQETAASLQVTVEFPA